MAHIFYLTDDQFEGLRRSFAESHNRNLASVKDYEVEAHLDVVIDEYIESV